MPYLFPSPEWVEQLRIEINRNQAYRRSGKTWEGDFYFTVEAVPGLKEPFELYLDLWHGECRDAHVVTGKGIKKPEFVIAGSLDTYRRIFTKKLDPIQALMTRKLKLEGNMMKIMRSVKATIDLVNCCSLIDTVYPEEA